MIDGRHARDVICCATIDITGMPSVIVTPAGRFYERSGGAFRCSYDGDT